MYIVPTYFNLFFQLTRFHHRCEPCTYYTNVSGWKIRYTLYQLCDTAAYGYPRISRIRTRRSRTHWCNVARIRLARHSVTTKSRQRLSVTIRIYATRARTRVGLFLSRALAPFRRPENGNVIMITSQNDHLPRVPRRRFGVLHIMYFY